MAFTNEDKKRVTDRFINDPRSHRAKTIVIGLKDMQGILLRLEAAELKECNQFHCGHATCNAWRKECEE